MGDSKKCPKFAFEVRESDRDPEMVALIMTRNGFQHHVETIPRDAAPAVGLALLSYRPAAEIEEDPAKEWAHLGAQEMLVECIEEVRRSAKEGYSTRSLCGVIIRRLKARQDPDVTIRECKAEDISEDSTTTEGASAFIARKNLESY